MKDVYDIVSEFKARPEQPLALASVVRAEGSSYRRPGARLLICAGGRKIGSLSGGCIEDEIAERARDVIETGQPVLVDFDTRKRFGCHGKIDVFIERLEHRVISQLVDYLDRRQCCIVTTIFRGNDSPLGTYFGEIDCSPDTGFLQEIHPRIRLIVFGDGPDSVPLRDLCSLLGWETLETPDVRHLFAEPDGWTAAVVKSHNFGRDFAALTKLLPLNLRYVGLVGPKKRRDELLNELLQMGLPMNAGLFAPAGIDLNAETPEEIALSIVSEIQRVFADGSGQSLRDRKQPIHANRKAGRQNATIAWPISAP